MRDAFDDHRDTVFDCLFLIIEALPHDFIFFDAKLSLKYGESENNQSSDGFRWLVAASAVIDPKENPARIVSSGRYCLRAVFSSASQSMIVVRFH